MLGSKGVKTNGSKTTANTKNYHIDIENFDPGGTPASIHIQPYKSNVKYYYNPNDGKLYIKTDNGFIQAPNNIQKILDDPNIQKGIEKGLYYLGE